ncbi:ABC transporter ATP-binding protein [Oceanibacterium hippocampi]|uniref:Lipopolysaccharide export system ATP-binding protein LptB n=1 Tax=Oceanibacterium hippocampi TaxID=745714 RepID=A0A1Y5TN74_9PROT|nr:ABC transporter ATP-binding protein [Oceanibacterium hippocampi]SLN64315.1 Lipopolysaccharide export system ATP-binding protein LptB [Oceanibacterium hippocampi]
MSLRISNVDKWLGGVRVLDNVSMEVPDGGLIGLIGPNGAGKSTLFAVVSGFEPADGGEVRFADSPLGSTGPVARARRGLMRTFQVPRPFSKLTVRENLAAAAPGQRGETLWGAFFGAGAARAEQAAIRERADAIIDFLNLNAVRDSLAGQVSGGQRKLIELGRVLMAEPKMILLDEPFAGVNPVLQEEISDHIRTLNGQGIGFLIVEHNLAALSRLVGHLYAMDRGRMLMDGTPADVLADPVVREAYTGGAV